MMILRCISLALLAFCLLIGLGGASLIDERTTTENWYLDLQPHPDSVLAALPNAATYAQARDHYVAGAVAWSQAWGSSDISLIRQYLGLAKTEYTDCLTIANAVNDPSNAANLAIIRSVSTAYIALADAALAMYDAADAYGAGQNQVSAWSMVTAGASFQSAAERATRSQGLFDQATSTLQSISYAGTEYPDGAAYTAVIVPILNNKASYMRDYATYAEAWQHTALALQARDSGDLARLVSEGRQAMNLFAGLRSSSSFGADATTNYKILESLIPPTVVPDTTTPTPTPTPPSTTPGSRPRLSMMSAFIPSGWMGDHSDISLFLTDTSNPHSPPDSIRIGYSAAGSMGQDWAGIYWLYPENNWGNRVEGQNLAGYSRLTFWARGKVGGEHAEFKVGGVTGTYPDSLALRTTGNVKLTTGWQQYSIDLSGEDLSHVIGGFCWVTNADLNPDGCTIYLDDIYFE